MADQLAASFLPCYGHPVVKAPALDRLAARGVRFTSAYSNSPLCAPARSAMMTGQLNSRIGAYDNASELAASVPTFAHHLRAGGYQTCLVGKMHFIGPDQLHGFESRLSTDIYPVDFGWTPNWDDSEGRFDWWFHNMDSVLNAGVAEATNQLDYDDEVGYHAVRKLRDLARSSDDRPWMLTVSFTHPHDPYAMRRRYWDRYDHEAIDLPRIGPLPDDALDAHSRRLRRVSAMDDVEVTDEHIRNARHAYYAAVSYIDDWVAMLVDTLETCDMADDTVLVFTADHGDMLGERGLWYKMNFFEGACRIPLIVAGPGLSPAEAPDHVSLLDLFPSLLDLAEVAMPEGIDGTSLVDLLGGDGDAERTVLGEYLAEGAAAPILMIRRNDWKFVYSAADPPQLYDLAADSDELVNLAADPAHAETVAAFDKEVHARWDPDAIYAAVVASQRARRTVDAALRTGHHTPWDHRPPSDPGQQYMRNHLDLNVVERARRLPPRS
ncbi:MAG: choline-sulfatase [Actinomycetota bacterium]|nr:choline-sulfatase [Actinomycetota bacterium]